MDHQVAVQDMELSKLLDSKECQQYLEKDEKGEKVIPRSGWDMAHA